MHLQWFEFRYQDGVINLVKNSGGKITPPTSLPNWHLDEDMRVLVIVVRGGDALEDGISVSVDVAPTLIKGWNIYQMEKVRLTDGGMFNDRNAVFYIKSLTASEQTRIDLLTCGPYREASVKVR